MSLLTAAWLPSGALAQTQGVVSFTVVESPLAVTLSLPENAAPGQWVDARVTVQNLGPAPLTAGRVGISADTSFQMSGQAERKFGRLTPGGSSSFKWRLKFNDHGVHSVVAEARAAESAQRTHVNGDTAQIAVTQGLAKLFGAVLMGLLGPLL
jgi:uncharacterized protein YfaS (alpha-2-macroglobulin family)